FAKTFLMSRTPNERASTPKNTFGLHNGINNSGAAYAAASLTTPVLPSNAAGGDTIMLPYDWLVHMDRPLANQLELLHVTAVKPHQLTQDFVHDNPANPGTRPPRKDLALAPWLGVNQVPPGTGPYVPGYDATNNQTTTHL